MQPIMWATGELDDKNSTPAIIQMPAIVPKIVGTNKSIILGPFLV
jgi:hypothetical protein